MDHEERVKQRLDILGITESKIAEHAKTLDPKYIEYLLSIGFKEDLINLCSALARTDHSKQQESVQQIITRDILRDEYPYISGGP